MQKNKRKPVKKLENKKLKKVKGFNMNKKTGHVSYVYWQKNREVHSIGFTHNANNKTPVKPMQRNIDPDDPESCYVKTDIERQHNNEYRAKEKYKNFRIHAKDKPLISSIIATDKKVKQQKKKR